MAFKTVLSLDADNTISLGGFNKKTKKDNPTSAEGYFLGSREVDQKNGKSMLHFLQTPKGNLGVWGKTDMNRKLANAEPGTMIRVSFTGMQDTPKGEMYKFKVEVDEDNTIEVGDLAASESQGDSGSEETVDEGEETTDDDNDSDTDNDADEAPAKTASTVSAADRAAKVQALLKGKTGTKRA